MTIRRCWPRRCWPTAWGLRHAVDADHLAVIDNVVRAAVDAQPGSALTGVRTGLWFALGHSTVVALACAAVAGTWSAYGARIEPIQRFGETVGPLLSTTLVLVVALTNTALLVVMWRRRLNGAAAPAGLGSGALGRLLRPLQRRVVSGWAMYPVGFLMGLGFDTACEVALLALAATQAAKGLPLASILIFPALFATGMALLDTLNGWLMLGTYRWAADDAGRRFYCNFGATAISVAVAFAIAGWQIWESFGAPAKSGPSKAVSTAPQVTHRQG